MRTGTHLMRTSAIESTVLVILIGGGSVFAATHAAPFDDDSRSAPPAPIFCGQKESVGTVEKKANELSRFEFQPFVFVVDEHSSSKLLVSPVRSDVTSISIQLEELSWRLYFGTGELVLLDDGVPPDDIAGDGVFTGTVTLSEDPCCVGGVWGDNVQIDNINDVDLTLYLSGGGSIGVTETVGAIAGFIQSTPSVSKVTVAPGVFHIGDVVNIVDPLLLDPYPNRAAEPMATSNAFFDNFPDRFDWLVIYNIYNYVLPYAGSFMHARNSVQGIGASVFDNGAAWGSDSALRGVIQTFKGIYGVTTHETFHTWGVFGLSTLGLLGGPHWGALAVGNPRSIFSSPSVYQNFVDLGGGSFEGCVTPGEPPLDIELYLMGLAPSDQIGTYNFVENAAWLSSGSMCTPTASHIYSGEGIGVLDEAAVLSTLGTRNPAYPDVNRFRAAVVLVSDRELEDVELAAASFAFQSNSQTYSDKLNQLAWLCYDLYGADTSSSYTLTVNLVGAGAGNVRSIPKGIYCDTDCEQTYGCLNTVDLTATPDDGSVFSGWSGDADCSDGTVTMNADVACTATFTLDTHLLTVDRSGDGSGAVTSSPIGIDCGSDCSESYDYGTAVALTATPATGSSFSGWSGDADCTDGSVTMNADVACTATFAIEPQPPTAVTDPAINVTVSGATLHGTVNPNGFETTVEFQYGTTEAYGQTEGFGSVGAGSSAVAVELPVSGLACGTTYHYQVSAVNAGGSDLGGDRSFSTAVCPEPDPIFSDGFESGKTSAWSTTVP